MRLVKANSFCGHSVCTGFRHFVRRLFTERTVLLALVVGCGLQMFQQLSGINTVM